MSFMVAVLPALYWVSKSWFVENYGRPRGGVYRLLFGNSGAWLDGYQGESMILLDEYTNQLPCSKMISFLDKTPCRAETKFGSEWAQWTTVFITSNIDPATWYQPTFVTHDGVRKGTDPENISALLRRMAPPYGQTFHWDGPMASVLGGQPLVPSLSQEQAELLEFLEDPDNFEVDKETTFDDLFKVKPPRDSLPALADAAAQAVPAPSPK